MKLFLIIVGILLTMILITLSALYSIGKSNSWNGVENLMGDNEEWKDGKYERESTELVFSSEHIPIWKVVIQNKIRGSKLAFYWRYYPWSECGVQSE